MGLARVVCARPNLTVALVGGEELVEGAGEQLDGEAAWREDLLGHVVLATADRGRRQGRPIPVAVFPFTEIGEAHQVMRGNRHRDDNMAALVSVPAEGLTAPCSGALATAAQ
jgi:hypothetical protein